jgi:tetratricopeptide (TPR) repeat protein
MTQVITRLTVVGCALAALLLTVAPTGAQIPDKFTNLKLLDKEIGKQELIGIMKDWAGGLGVRCNHCHVGPDNLQGMDFATDEKEHKRAARSMLEMSRAINRQYIGSWEEESEKGEKKHQVASCYTCHRGQPKPPRKLTWILGETAMSEGVDVAMEQYKELKNDYYGAGVYDFREGIFEELAQMAFNAGKLDVAMQILQSSLEIYPDSADLHATLGMALLQSGDATGAAGSFEKALGLDPENAIAKRGKTMLERSKQ